MLAVVLYHGGVSWAVGGFIGVEVFFVLSGFLITSLLVAEWSRSGSIALSGFWARRARRLLPALLLLLFAIGVYYAVAGPAKAVPGLKADGLSTLLYAGNWHQIVSHSSYFAATGPVSPLKHTWSLAIEEQFYLCWPVLLVGILWAIRRRRRPEQRDPRHALMTLFWISVAGAVACAIDMALLFRGGSGLDRVYYGTDTRAGGLLAGASLAFALALFSDWLPRARERRARIPARLLGPVALAALLGVLAATRYAHGDAAWLYPYGMVGIDLAVVAVIAAVVVSPGTLVGRTLALAPLRAIGTISYGIYLWHFPLFLWLDTGSTGLRGIGLLAVRLAVTLVVSGLSYVLIEQPVRRQRLPSWLVRSLAPVAAAGAAISIVVGSTLASMPVGDAAAAVAPKAPPGLKGDDPACRVTLTDADGYGLAPLPASEATKDEYAALGAHQLSWSGSSTRTFHTCPPKRVLLVGDSLAYTLGVGMAEEEDRYGIELANAAILGCAFTTSGELNVAGTWEGQSAGCPNALQQWSRDEQRLHPQAVIVELGYRDQFDWRWGEKQVHLGDASYDAYVERQIERYASVLGRGGVKVLFLSVPWSQPPSLPDGSPSPAASPDRHRAINAMLRAVARRHPKQIGVVDIDKVIAPGNRYQATLHGQLCRFDGVHFSLFCAKQLEPSVLGTVRKMIGT